MTVQGKLCTFSRPDCNATFHTTPYLCRSHHFLSPYGGQESVTVLWVSSWWYGQHKRLSSQLFPDVLKVNGHFLYWSLCIEARGSATGHWSGWTTLLVNALIIADPPVIQFTIINIDGYLATVNSKTSSWHFVFAIMTRPLSNQLTLNQGLSQRPVYPSFGRVIPFVDG